MVRRTAPALIIAALIVACGGGGSSTSKSSPSPTISAAGSTPSARPGGNPSPVAGLCADQLTGSAPLMAVLEAKGSSTSGTGVSFFDAHDTLAIAGLDAVARARSTFAPRSHPYIGNAATLLSPNEAYVVHGTAYFIDGFGTVFSMGADGVQRTAARFPIGLDQQEVSFAVSPDGCQLVASVLTIPPKGPAPSGGGFPTLNGTWKLQTMNARVGGQTQLLHSWSSTSAPDSPGSFKNLVMVGWDSTGPLVVVGSALGSQNMPYVVINPDFLNGTIAHLTADGTPGTPVPLPGCSGIQVSSAGMITCYAASADGQSATVSVVDSAGAVQVSGFPVTGQTEIAVGPDKLVALTGQWRGQNAVVGTLPANFHPEGWVDVNTIFGRLSDPSSGIADAALAHLSGSQATIEDLKFKGDYVSALN